MSETPPVCELSSQIVSPLLLLTVCLPTQLASYLSFADTVETRQAPMEETLKKEVNLAIVVEHENMVKWIEEGSPAAFTAEVLDAIIKKLVEGGYVGTGAGVDVWRGACLHAKSSLSSPSDETLAQAGKVTWLNGLLEEVCHTLYIVEYR